MRNLALPATGVALIAGAGLGFALAANPDITIVSIGASAALLGVTWLLRFRSAWRWTCAALLFGYIVLDRGFAYISLNVAGVPVYIGELTLLLCFLAIPHRAVLHDYLTTSPGRWVLPWIILGIVLTLPGLASYGLIALRDFSVCYYAIFTYVGYAFAERERDSDRLLRLVGVAFVVHLAYGIAQYAGAIDETVLPLAPGSDFPLFSSRWDIGAINALGGVLFLLLLGKRYRWPAWLCWLLGMGQLALGFALTARAAMVGFVLAAGLLIYARRFSGVLRISLMAALLLLVAMGVESSLPLERWGVTSGQIVEKVMSMFDVGGGGTYRYAESEIKQANVQWRLEFWQLVIADSLQSIPRLLLGGGFGPDLVRESKFVANSDRPNRSPHSIFVMVLARTGLVGLALWTIFHVAVYQRVLRALRPEGRTQGGSRRDELTFVGAYTLNTLGAAFFGVVLDAPFAAIPFYFFLGLAMKWAEPRRAVDGFEKRRHRVEGGQPRTRASPSMHCKDSPHAHRAGGRLAVADTSRGGIELGRQSVRRQGRSAVRGAESPAC